MIEIWVFIEMFFSKGLKADSNSFLALEKIEIYTIVRQWVISKIITNFKN